MIEVVLLLAAGFTFGVIFVHERQQHREEKTLDQVDAEVRRQLQYYKNLSESLKADVIYLRKKVEGPQDINEKHI